MYDSNLITTASDPIVKRIAKMLGYRKKKASVVFTEAVTLSDLNWSGGTRSTYTAIDLATMAGTTPDLGRPAPWDNTAEGKTVPIPDGVVIVRTGTFCGKPGLMTVYAPPSAKALLLTSEAA